MQKMFYKFSWTVIWGKEIWRTINFPTANINLKKEAGLLDGTYCINGNTNGNIYRWVWVYREKLELFEAHFFDFDADIYWKEIEIAVYAQIRENMKFENIWELQNQIQKDVTFAKETQYNVLSFWTFDILHPGHEHYLNSAKMYGNTLITIVATAKNREKTIGNIPQNSLSDRVESLGELAISDIIEEGSEDTPMIWFEKYSPKVICLWYDQISFSKLITSISEEIEVIRLDSYFPEQFKSSKLR